jgi:hypothetical protein
LTVSFAVCHTEGPLGIGDWGYDLWIGVAWPSS